MVMWFGFDWPSKAAVVALVTFFPMLVNSLAGLSASGHMERDLMRSYRVSSDRGTLLLDEIGDLPLSAQAALLRVLQEKEVQAVGSVRPVKVDLRVVAATHRDLAKLSGEAKFRTDLLARLSGFTFQLPPLRERQHDLGLLVAAILRKGAREGTAGISFSSEAARALLLHDWPHNVRELEKCVVGAAVLSKGGRIDLEHLPDEVRAASEGRPPPQPAEPRDEDLG